MWPELFLSRGGRLSPTPALSGEPGEGLSLVAPPTVGDPQQPWLVRGLQVTTVLCWPVCSEHGPQGDGRGARARRGWCWARRGARGMLWSH